MAGNRSQPICAGIKKPSASGIASAGCRCIENRLHPDRRFSPTQTRSRNWQFQQTVRPSSLESVEPLPDADESPASISKPGKWLIAVASVLVGIGLVAGVVLRKPFTPVVPETRLGRLLTSATSEGSQLSIIPIPMPLAGISASAAGDVVFAFDFGNRISKVSIASRRVSFIDPKDPVRALVCSSDGETLYTGTSRGVRMIAVATGEARDINLGGTVTDLALGPRGERLYAAVPQRGVFEVTLPTGKPRLITSQPEPFFVARDPLGRKLSVSYQNGGPGGVRDMTSLSCSA